MEVIAKERVQRAHEAQKDRIEMYHYLMCKHDKENRNDGYERIH